MATILVKDLLNALEGVPSGAEVRVAWLGSNGVQFVENLTGEIEHRQIEDWPFQIWLHIEEITSTLPRKVGT